MNSALVFTLLCVGMAFLIGLMLYSRNLVHIAYLFLGVLLLGSVPLMLLQLHVAAASQIMIYAGGVLIVMLFAIMLTKSYTQVEPTVRSWYKFSSLFFWFFFSGGMAVVLFLFPPNFLDTNAPGIQDLSGKSLAQLWLHKQIIPFELSAVLLLVCLVGAIYTASAFRKE